MNYYGISEKYDPDNCDDYIGVAFKIRYIDKKRSWYEADKNDPQMVFISATKEKDKTTIAHKRLQVPKDFKILPMIRQNVKNKDIQRSIMLVYGASGSGKSVLTTDICKVYKMLNDNPIIYVSSKNMLIDPSFDKRLYEFVEFNTFMNYFMNNPENYKNFEASQDGFLDNCLLVLDDLVFKNKEVKDFFYNKLLQCIITLKRMNGLNLIYALHEMTDYKNTRILFNETTDYISFSSDLKNRSSLVLKNYFKLNKNEIEMVNNSATRWTSINTRKKLIITENEIQSLD